MTQQTPLSFSIVIPTLNAEPYLERLLPALTSTGPDSIIFVDSNSTDATVEIASTTPGVEVLTINNFSHGRARNLGAKHCTSDIVIFLSQDALPSSSQWAQSLLEPFSDPNVALTFSRQIPYPDASPMEQFFLAHRFPEGPDIRREVTEARELTMADTFCSNASSAVRRKVLMATPFDEEIIMAEDQKFASEVLLNGYATVYTPDSVVVHSHRYTLCQTFKRYFDSVYALTQLFPRQSLDRSAGIGIAYVMNEIVFLLKRAPLWLPYYALYTLVKAAATLLAHRAHRLSPRMLQRISMHSYYWK